MVEYDEKQNNTFKVLKPIDNIVKSTDRVFFKIEEIIEIDDSKFVVLKHNGIGPDEIEVPESRFISWIDEEKIRLADYDPQVW